MALSDDTGDFGRDLPVHRKNTELIVSIRRRLVSPAPRGRSSSSVEHTGRLDCPSQRRVDDGIEATIGLQDAQCCIVRVRLSQLASCHSLVVLIRPCQRPLTLDRGHVPHPLDRPAALGRAGLRSPD